MPWPTPIQDLMNTATGASSGDWQSALLAAIGAPNTTTNRLALTYWHQSEGTQPGANNWLAISDGANLYPHAGTLAQGGTSSPIYAFPSQDVGVQATAHFLSYGYYTGVVDAFRRNAGLAAIWQAINASPWCKNCQGGQYPVALAQAAQGNPPAVTDSTSAGTSTSSSSDTTAAGHLSVAAAPKRQDHCLWGEITMPGNVPDLHASYGCALLGGLAFGFGLGLFLFGAVLATGIAAPRVPGLPRLPARATSAGMTDEELFTLRQQRDAEARRPPSVRTVSEGGTSRSARTVDVTDVNSPRARS